MTGGGPLATNGIEAGVKIRPTEEELKRMDSWPCNEFRSGWDSYFKDKPDKPVMHYSVIAGFFGDHMNLPPGKYFSQFHFLEYPFSRGSTHINSADPYEVPDFDAGFMNDPRDMAPMVWAYIHSRETSRRMDAYAGEVTSHHPFFGYDSPAAAKDMDLETAKAYGGPNHLTAGLQHGSWTVPVKKAQDPKSVYLNSSQKEVRGDLEYSEEDIKAIVEWGTYSPPHYPVHLPLQSYAHSPPLLAVQSNQIKQSSATWKRPGTRLARAAWRPRRGTASSSTACWTSA